MEQTRTSRWVRRWAAVVILTLVFFSSLMAGTAAVLAFTPDEGINLGTPSPEPVVTGTVTPASTPVGTPLAAPAARCCAAMTYDEATSSILLFGGAGVTENFGDTWIWNGSAWNQPSPALTPNPLYNAAMAYDAAHGNIVMFGGQDSTSLAVNQTWLWNGTVWSQATPATAPAPRASANLVYDAAHGVVLLFGGCCADGGQPYNDTWTWDGSTWTQLSPSTSPPGSESASIAYDAARQLVILFGGCCGGSDTWTWNGTTWTRQATTGPTVGGAMAFDVARGVVVLVQNDGTTWTWNGTSWSQQATATSPVPRDQPALAYDSSTQTMLFYGGSGNGFPLDDSWSWNGSAWIEETPPTNLPPVLDLKTDLAPD